MIVVFITESEAWMNNAWTDKSYFSIGLSLKSCFHFLYFYGNDDLENDEDNFLKITKNGNEIVDIPERQGFSIDQTCTGFKMCPNKSSIVLKLDFYLLKQQQIDDLEREELNY